MIKCTGLALIQSRLESLQVELLPQLLEFRLRVVYRKMHKYETLTIV
jgi:hypothetical protein